MALDGVTFDAGVAPFVDPAPADESFEVEAVWLDGVRLEPLGPIQGPAKVTALADKIVTGDHTRASDPVLSSWIVENLTGGLGVLNRDTETHQDRYRIGNLWCLHPKQVTLGVQATEYPQAAVPGARPRCAATYHGTLYVAWDLNVLYLASSTGTWAPPAEPGYGALLAPATDMCVLRIGTTDWLIIADGAGYLKFDGTTWTYVTGNGNTLPRAQWLHEYDGQLCTIDNANRFWVSANTTTWDGQGTVPVEQGEVRGLDVFFNQDNEPVPHAPTREGLYQYVPVDEVWLFTRLRFGVRHPSGGDGHAQWQDEYYQSAGLDIYHYSGSQITPLSLARDDGLPRDYAGNIAVLCPLPNWLIVGVDAAESVVLRPDFAASVGPFSSPRVATLSGVSSLYLWTGSAWHLLWQAAEASAALAWVHYSAVGQDPNSAEPHLITGVPTLYWGVGTRVYALPLGNGLFNPREQPRWPYAQTGFLETGRDDANWAEQTKLGVRTLLRTEGCTATETVQVSYRVDRTQPWVVLGLVTTNGLTVWHLEQTPGAVDGLPWYDFEYRLDLARGANPYQTPVVVFLKLEYVRLPDARFGYRFQARVSEEFESGGQTAMDQAAHLLEMANAKRLLQFVYKPRDRSPVTRRCLLTTWMASGAPGGDTNNVYSVALEEA